MPIKVQFEADSAPELRALVRGFLSHLDVETGATARVSEDQEPEIPGRAAASVEVGAAPAPVPGTTTPAARRPAA